MEFLKQDLQHLFDDQGIDKSQYNDVVEFKDPITKYDNASGDFSFAEMSHLSEMQAPNRRPPL